MGMDNTVNHPEVERLSVAIDDEAKQLREAHPAHPLMVWHVKLWRAGNLPEQTARLRTRAFVHRFTTDKSARKNFMVDDQVKIDVLVKYLGAIEDALRATANKQEEEAHA
jgi:hypothetical protein